MINDCAITATFTNHTAADTVVKKLAAAGYEMTTRTVVGKADAFLVMALGTAKDTARAKAILVTTGPSRLGHRRWPEGARMRLQ